MPTVQMARLPTGRRQGYFLSWAPECIFIIPLNFAVKTNRIQGLSTFRLRSGLSYFLSF